MRILGITGVGHAATHAWELSFPAIAIPLARDLGLSFEAALALAWPLFLWFGLGAPLAGWASDRFGPRAVLLTCLIGGGVSGVAIAYARTPAELSLALGALGLAASLYHPSGLALLSTHFSDKLGRAFALNGIAGNVGIAATPFAAGLCASWFGWRAAYLVLCVPVLAIGIVFLFLPFEDRVGSSAARPQDRAAEEPVAWGSLVALAVAVTAGGLAYRLHTLVVPALIGERVGFLAEWTEALGLANFAHLDNLGATFLTSIAYAMGIFGQWWGGRVADRHVLTSAYLAFHLAALPLLVLTALATGVPLLLVLFGYLFFAIGMQPIENSLVGRMTPAAWRGRAYAGKFILAFGVGSLGAYIVGWVEPFGGLAAAVGAAAVFEVVLIAAIVVIGRREAGTVHAVRAPSA